MENADINLVGKPDRREHFQDLAADERQYSDYSYRNRMIKCATDSSGPETEWATGSCMYEPSDPI